MILERWYLSKMTEVAGEDSRHEQDHGCCGEEERATRPMRMR